MSRVLLTILTLIIYQGTDELQDCLKNISEASALRIKGSYIDYKHYKTIKIDAKITDRKKIKQFGDALQKIKYIQDHLEGVYASLPGASELSRYSILAYDDKGECICDLMVTGTSTIYINITHTYRTLKGEPIDDVVAEFFGNLSKQKQIKND